MTSCFVLRKSLLREKCPRGSPIAFPTNSFLFRRRGIALSRVIPPLARPGNERILQRLD
jgi:hypothetical protein